MTLAAAERARASGGTSNSAALYALVGRLVAERHGAGGVLVDVGCGQGACHAVLGARFDRYVGIDVVRYAQFPSGPAVEFHAVDLDSGRSTCPDGCADVVCSLETIEHVENPRSFMRELVRLARPGALIIVTTPNQLSLLSKLSLLLRNEFVHFQERPGLYPSHLSALLEVDLVRLARENGLRDVEVHYTGDGRMPRTARHWPRWLGRGAGWRGRLFSDNVLLCARRAGHPAASAG